MFHVHHSLTQLTGNCVPPQPITLSYVYEGYEAKRTAANQRCNQAFSFASAYKATSFGTKCGKLDT